MKDANGSTPPDNLVLVIYVGGCPLTLSRIWGDILSDKRLKNVSRLLVWPLCNNFKDTEVQKRQIDLSGHQRQMYIKATSISLI